MRYQIADKLGPYKGSLVAVAALGPEALDLAIDSGETLRTLGWNWIDWPFPGDAIATSGRPSIGVQVLDGIDIRALNPDLLGAATALEEIFKGAGWAKVRVGHPEAVSTENPNVMLIIVGTKP